MQRLSPTLLSVLRTKYQPRLAAGIIIGAAALGGCNGASDSSDSDTDSGVYSLSMAYKTYANGSCEADTSRVSFETDTSFCAVATLLLDDVAVSGQLVSFSQSFGDLSVTSKLTNTNGEAEVILSSSDAEQGAGSITATFTDTDNSVTESSNYEFVAATVSASPVTLTSLITKDSATTSRFQVDELTQLQAQLLDQQNQGIENIQVNFAAGSATLLPSSALTNAQGIAQVPYTPGETELGVNTLSVSLTYNGIDYQSSRLYEVLSASVVEDDATIKMGRFNADGLFIENELATTLTPDENGQYTISAGGSFGVSATLVSEDQNGVITRLQSPAAISFSSDCFSSDAANLDTPVTTLSGSASSTFQDASCSGNSVRNDQITASAVVGNQTLSASLSFALARQTIASLSFVSAEPSTIRIRGAGGTDSLESSLVTFKVTSANGQAAAQQPVDFELDTIVGGLSFANNDSTTDGLTNSEGLVSVRVLAGTVPTPVRVVASSTDSDTNETITSQSEQLTVNTGLPQQLGFSLSTSTFNPEAGDFNGEITTITAYASDSFGNPAPDDTTINFTTEGGQIEPSCATLDGRCSVQWTSADARVTDHRITVLAYALGHETFFDTNGNNIFDTDDGTAVTDACLDSNGSATTCSGNGMNIDTYHPRGFVDLDDAFRDDNENGAYDSGERFFNTEANISYGVADGLFNGPQCEGELCGTGQANKTYIRKALIMTMSGSDAQFALFQGSTKVYDARDGTNSLATLVAIASDETAAFTVQLFDDANQILPAGTNVSVSANKGELDADALTVANITRAGGSALGFTLSNDLDAEDLPTVSTVTVDVTTPKGVISKFSFSVSLN